MPPAPDGIPWLVWVVAVIMLAVIGNLPGTITALRARKDLHEVKEQVQNTHTSNLREDLDKVGRHAEDAEMTARLSLEASHRTERLTEDMLKSLRATEHAIDRRDNLHADAMEELREDLAKHIKAADERWAAQSNDST